MPLFPYDQVATYFRETFKDVKEIAEGKLSWSALGGTTSFIHSEISHATNDGLLVSEEVVLEHIHPDLQDVTPDFAARINKWCTLSSFVPATSDSPGKLMAKVGIFSTDREAAERLYAPLIAMEAVSVGWHAACLSAGEYRANPESSPFSNTDKQPPYTQEDFQSVKSLIDNKGFVGSLADRHYTVEFPWDVGAISSSFRTPEVQDQAREAGYSEEQIAIAGGRTSLFQVMFIQHPLYGWGIQSRLELPVTSEKDGGVSLVDELNRWELSAPELPPLFGSWCLGDRAPAFLTFIPTQMCLPGLIHNLTMWGLIRNISVRNWLEGSSSTPH